MRFIFALVFLNLSVGCRTQKSNLNEDNLAQIKSSSNKRGDAKLVCESDAPETRYYLDEPNDRNLTNWNENFEASVEEDLNSKDLLKERKHRLAVYLWGESTYSFIRLLQAFDLQKIEKAYPKFKGETATWYKNLTSDFEDALNILFEKNNGGTRTVYRGAKIMDPELLECWQKNSGAKDAYIELGAGGHRGAASTSARVTVAQKFSGAAGTMITITATSMVEISQFKKNSTETEYVLLPGARFQITNFEKKNLQTLITLTELPGDTQAH